MTLPTPVESPGLGQSFQREEEIDLLPSEICGAPVRAWTTIWTADDLRTLFLRWQALGDRAARERLVARFIPLARSLARRYGRSSEPFEDLLQVAALGLLKAIDRFDPERGNPFPSFAVPTILGEMRRYFRDAGWAVHLPRGMQERVLTVRDAQSRLASQHGHAPTVGQLAEYLELDTEEIIDALQAFQANETLVAKRPATRPG